MERMRGFISGRHGLLRLLTVLFSFSLLLGAIGPGAQAAPPVDEIPRIYPVSDHEPQITIQANGVVDAAGKLTGFVEVALLVRTSVYYDTAVQATLTQAEYDAAVAGGALPAGEPGATIELRRHKFQSVSVALGYNTSILTPVDWRVESADSALSAGEGAVDVTGATLKNPVMVETAKPTSMFTGTAYINDYDGDLHTAMLAMTVQAMSAGMEFDEPTAVLVVRFAYDLTVMANEALMKAPVGVPQLLGPKFARSFESQALWFASDGMAALSPATQIVWYEGTVDENDEAETRFFAYQNQPAISGTGPSPTGDIPYPDTAGQAVLTEDASAAPGGYSYIENLLPFNGPHELISFTHVNEPSYLAGGTNLDDVIAIVFYDWDDTLIGVLNVPRGDVRKQVNEYIEANFIHPDLRASNPANASLPGYFDNSWTGGGESGLDRKYTYRGKFDFNGPQPSDTLHGSAANTVSDGETYPLTAKLDYAFYKRATRMVSDPVYTIPGDDTSGLVSETRYWRYDTMAVDDYPYVHGWAVVERPGMLGATWTTLGTGELQEIKPKDIAGTTALPVGLTFDAGETGYHYKTSAPGAAEYFQFADFSDLDPAVTGNSLVVKAVYEQGTWNYSTGYYTMTVPPYYTRYNMSGSDANGAYSIQYTLSRRVVRNDSGINGVVGVGRGRDLGVRMQNTIDPRVVSGNVDAQKSNYSKVAVENTEDVVVDMIVAVTAYAVDYMLIDEYGVNIVEGQQRSAMNASQVLEAQIPTNFKYDAAGITYAKRFGTPGIIFQATLNVIMEKGTQLVRGEITSVGFENHLGFPTIQDLNLRRNVAGLEYTAGTSGLAIPLITAAIQYAYDQHMLGTNTWWDTEQDQADISYHELQQFIINNNTAGGLTDDDCDYFGTPVLHYDWCRQHEECLFLAPDTLDSLKDLLAAAWDVAVNGGDPALLNSFTFAMLQSADYGFHDPSGNVYTNVLDFLNDLRAMASAMNAAAVPQANFENLDWNQTQYALMNGNTYTTPGNAAAFCDANCYWAGGGQPVTDWASLLAAAKIAATGGSQAALNTAELIYVNNNVSYGLRNFDGANYVAFADFDEFKATLIAALSDPDVPANPTWDTIQYYIEFGAYDPSTTVMDDHGKATYYFYNGGSELTISSTLEEVLAAANVARLGRSAGLNSLDLLELANNPNLGFRRDFSGGAFLYINDFKDALVRINQANSSTTLAWNVIQYALIRTMFNPAATVSVPTTTVANAEGNSYYWWKNVAAQGATAFSSTNQAALIDALVGAAYRSQVNGHAAAWASLSANVTSVLSNVRLISAYSPADDFAAQPSFTAAELQTAMENMMDAWIVLQEAAAVPSKPTTLDWRLVQYYLLNGDFNDSGVDPVVDPYWWQFSNTNPNNMSETPVDIMDELFRLMYDVDNGMGATTDDIEDYLTVDRLNALGLVSWYEGPFDESSLSEYAGGWLWSGVLPGGLEYPYSWYSIQMLYLECASRGSAADDEAAVLGDYAYIGITAPSWWSTYVSPVMSPLNPFLPFQAALGLDRQTTGDETVTTTTVTETTVEDGVVIVRVTVTTTAAGETVITTTVTVTTTMIHPDGTVETNTETTQSVAPACHSEEPEGDEESDPADEVAEDPSAVPQDDTGGEEERPPESEPTPSSEPESNEIDGGITLTETRQPAALIEGATTTTPPSYVILSSAKNLTPVYSQRKGPSVKGLRMTGEEKPVYYVYMLANWNNQVLYTGVTNNLARRVQEHRDKLVDGFTKKYNVSKLVYYDYTEDVYAAIAREKQIKGWTRAKKNDLVAAMNPGWEDLYNKIHG